MRTYIYFQHNAGWFTVRSMATAAGADRQAVAFWWSTLAANTPKTPTGSPDPKT
jgi:hypothetical protein